MVHLTSLLTTLAVAASTVSAVCVCTPAVRYCGYTLRNNRGCSASDLAGTPASTNQFNSLYVCNTGGTNATYIEVCGGDGSCQPPDHVGGDCNGVNSCCDPPATIFKKW